MASLASVFVDVRPQTNKFEPDLKRKLRRIDASREGKRVGDTFGKGLFGAVTAGNRGLRTSFGILGKGALFAAGAAGIGGLVEAFKGVYEEGREAQRTSAQTAAVIKSTGGVAKISANQIGSLATAISNKIGVDDEAIQSGENLLLTFTGIRNEAGKGNDIFNRASQTITDMAAAMNQGKVTGDGLKTAAIQVGKALNDPIKGMTALQKVGVTFTKGQKDQIAALVKSHDTLGAQKIILGELNKEFGGSAAAGTNAMQKLGVVFGNIKESIGTALLPAIDGIANWLSRVLPGAVAVGIRAFSAIGNAVKSLYDLVVKGDFTHAFAQAFHVSEDSGLVNFLFTARDGVLALESAFRDGDVTSDGFVGLMERIGVEARKAFEYIQTTVIPTLQQFGQWLVSRIVPALIGMAKWLVNNKDALLATGAALGVIQLGQWAEQVLEVAAAVREWAVAQGGLNAVLLANPITIIAGALAVLAAGFVIAYNRSAAFRDFSAQAWTLVKNLAVGAIQAILPTATRLWAFLSKNLGPTFAALGQLIMTRIWPALQGLFVRLQQVWPTFSTVIGFVLRLTGALLGLAIMILGKVLPVLIRLAGPIFTLVFAAIGKVIGIVAALVRIVANAVSRIVSNFLSMAGGIINAAAKAFGWVPGIGPKLKSAAAAFNHFRDQVNSALSGVKSRKITVTAELHASAGGGRNIGFAVGGPVVGPGTPTSDSILARLSRGEHVLTAADVDNFGGHAAVMRMRKAAAAGNLSGFAAGGPVGLQVTAQLTNLDRLHSSIAAFNKSVDKAAAALVPKVSSAPFAGGGSVSRWTPVVLAVLAALHQPGSLAGAVLRRIAFESGGNPTAINLSDSNARAGHPSQGLVQTIPGTFAAFAGPYASRGITDPFANIYAGMNYALHRYGSIAAIDPLVRPRGYDAGGWLPPGVSMAVNGTGRPERIRTAASEDALLGELRGLRRDLANLPVAQVDERTVRRVNRYGNIRDPHGW